MSTTVNFSVPKQSDGALAGHRVLGSSQGPRGEGQTKGNPASNHTGRPPPSVSLSAPLQSGDDERASALPSAKTKYISSPITTTRRNHDGQKFVYAALVEHERKDYVVTFPSVIPQRRCNPTTAPSPYTNLSLFTVNHHVAFRPISFTHTDLSKGNKGPEKGWK